MVPSTQMEHFLGVRKGAWTEDEDILLRKCIEKYGEGNWRHVPSRAGLNRCRKSCRLRWMNYLHPKIKRGEFSLDEIDLIVKMHRLLGNRQVNIWKTFSPEYVEKYLCKSQESKSRLDRWSLIAGRLPGRTANDIKNYWNTYINKRFPSQSNCTTNNNNKHKRKKKEIDIEIEDTTLNTQVIKPQPRTLSKNFQTWPNGETMQCGEASNNNSSQETSPLIEKNIPWWESILFDKADGEEELLTSFAKDDGSVQQGKSDWDDLVLDNVLELWDK